MCGQGWRYHYIDKVDVPTAPALVFGSAFHGATEKYITDGGDLSALWQENWTAQCERNQSIDWGAESAEGLVDTGRRMVTAKPVTTLLDELRAQYDVTNEKCGVERKVTLSVPGVPVPVIGYIDFVGTDGIPGDFKTAGRMWSDSQAADSMQSLFYLAALNQAGIEVPGWKFRHYVFTKTAKPAAQTFEVAHKPSELFWLFQMIQAAWKGIEAEVYPLNPGTWKCSAKWCEYWHLCRGKYN